MPNNILLTGKPRSGKSTLLRRLVEDLTPKKGFVSREILDKDARVGFLMTNHLGDNEILAHKDFEGEITVPSSSGSPYVVNIKGIDRMVSSVESFAPSDLLFLDEIGLMQCYSDRFQDLVRAYLDAPNTALMTVGQQEHPFLDEIRECSDVRVIPVNHENAKRVYNHFTPKLEDAFK